MILDLLQPRPPLVVLSGIGEPLLNPHFPELVDVLARRGIKCKLVTNGTLLTRRMRDAILARPNIVCVAISCDGARKETFEALRVGADFETWKHRLREFLSVVTECEPRRILTLTNTVVSKRNLTELAEIIRLAAGLGFQRAGFLDLIPVDEAAADMALSGQQRRSVDQKSLYRLGGSLGVKVMFQFRGVRRDGAVRCLQPWEYIWIRPGGDVHPCCALFRTGEAQVVGNLLREGLTGVWLGGRFRQFRKSYAEGKNPLCKICPYS